LELVILPEELVFMGGELSSVYLVNRLCDVAELDWFILEREIHRNHQNLVSALNKLNH